MPVSLLVKYGLLSSVILICASVTVHAQVETPLCGDDGIKDTVTNIIANNIHQQRQGLGDYLTHQSQLDWDTSSLKLKYITETDYNEASGIATCQATLEGQRDRAIYNRMPESLQLLTEFLEGQGYWNVHDISTFQYDIAPSAEESGSFVVSVQY